MDQTNDSDIFERTSIRIALKSWHHLPTLGKHPLIQLKIVRDSHLTANRADTPTGWGLSLRSVLRKAITSLKPSSSDLNLADPRWRAYYVLTSEYIDCLDPIFISAQLNNMPMRTYQDVRARSLERLGSILGEWEDELAQKDRVIQSDDSLRDVTPKSPHCTK